jgi:hypothetical protein
MNKITTKLRIIKRLVCWLTLSVAIALANSQTAHAWLAVNQVADNVLFLAGGSLYCNATDYFGCNSHDESMALGHTRSCGQDQTECGAGQGQDLSLAADLQGSFRLLYPAVHVPPNGIVTFLRAPPGMPLAGVYYTISDNEIRPGTTPYFVGNPVCQDWIGVVDPNGNCSANGCQGSTDYKWVNQPTTTLCDNAPDRARVP